MTRCPSSLLSSVLLLLALSAGPRAVAQDSPEVSSTLAITGGTILTVTKGTVENGTILIRDGRIGAIGADVAIPDDAEVVDARGRFVTPGLIDAHSHIAADSINEGGTSVSSMTGIEDVFDPTDIDIYRDLAGGLTTANILHGSANPIGGKNLVIKLRWGATTTEAFTFRGAPPGIKFALGENPKDMRQFGQSGPRRYPTSRLGVEFVIRDAFTRARAYQAARRSHEEAVRRGAAVLPPPRDLQLEPLVEVLEGRRLVHAHCYRADEILMLLRLAEELGFKIATLQHVLEGYKVAPEIAAHGAGASTFSDWWGYKIEAIDATPWNAALMTRRGVLVSVNSDSAEHARRLNTEAAKSVKWGGLTDDEALALVTINPARQLRIDQRVGSLEPGKDADLAIWTAHPLSSYAIVDRTYIDGRLYYDRSREEARVAERASRKASLLEAERARKENKKPSPSAPDTDGAEAKSDTAQGRHGGAPKVTEGRPTSATVPQRARPQAGVSGSLAIVNARIHPVTSPVIERGTIVIRGNRIEAIGSGVTVPDDAEVLDVAGAEVFPGWIDASSSLGLAEPGPRGFQDTAEMLEFNPHLRTRVAFHPDNDGIPVARANGITTVAVTPSGGLLGGEVALMNLDGWTWEEATLRPTVALALQFPSLTPPRRFGREQSEKAFDELKKERDGRLDALADLLERARAHARTPAVRRTKDWVLEALAPAVDGGLPFLVEADREDDIRAAIAFADRERVRVIIRGGTEAGRVAGLLAEKNIPVILGPVLRLPMRPDDHHAATYMTAAALAKAGVQFAFTSGEDATNVRLLPYHAAQSVAWGLDRERALRALTIDAASILGVADQVGSLERGKLANLFVATGDPLEVRTRVTEVVVAGRRTGVANRHQALYERYTARPVD